MSTMFERQCFLSVATQTINNSVGWVLHSAVGVPYQAWKISHGRHHAGCGHIARDEVYVPRTREQLVRFDTVRLIHTLSRFTDKWYRYFCRATPLSMRPRRTTRE